MKTITIHHAESSQATYELGRVVSITEPMPPYDARTTASTTALFEADAEAIHTVLRQTLPGGTYDRLFAVMAAHKASGLVVPAQP